MRGGISAGGPFPTTPRTGKALDGTFHTKVGPECVVGRRSGGKKFVRSPLDEKEMTFHQSNLELSRAVMRSRGRRCVPGWRLAPGDAYLLNMSLLKNARQLRVRARSEPMDMAGPWTYEAYAVPKPGGDASRGPVP